MRHTREGGEGVDGQAGADDEHQVRHGHIVDIVVKRFGERLAKEYNIRLDEPVAAGLSAVRDLSTKHVLLHLVVGEFGLALDAPLCREATVGLDDLVGGHTGRALEAVDILGEEHLEEAFAGEEGDEGVGDGGMEFSGVELVGEDIEGLGMAAEVGDVKDGFGVGEVQAGEVGVEACLGRSKVGN